MDICLIVMSFRLISYNCKGFNMSKEPFIKSLLSQCDSLRS